LFSTKLIKIAEQVILACERNNLRLVTAESCTGGLISACLTSVSGASKIYHCGYVTYTNQSKTDLLGVSAEILNEHGAVSKNVSKLMAIGAISSGDSDISVSVTGVAGPNGGTIEKPVGLVHISVARKNFEILHEKHLFDGNRETIRLQTVKSSLALLLKRMES
tara:strand:+ start:77 stop:568 length:492 start_codon:yes stop_codon:yes gene_type:complete